MSKFKDIKKAESGFERLIKIDPALKQHLAAIRQTHPESARFLAQKLFGDTMVPGIGNKAAYEDFVAKKKPGVYAVIDANDFGIINKKWGQSAGDEAIKAVGGAIKRASRATKTKTFRSGGDEFLTHSETPEQAHLFARTLRRELDALPAMNGQHKHSVSVGLGHSLEHAEQGLLHAKHAKKAAGKPAGQADTHVHSLLPGAEGPVETQPQSPPGFNPPAPSPAPKAPEAPPAGFKIPKAG